MSRLDTHINLVRRRLLMDQFYAAIARVWTVLLAVVVLCIIASRLFDFAIPHPVLVLLAAFVLTALAAGVYVYARRPSEREAAIAIDRELKLKEAFATTLYTRQSKDPFAAAATREGEQLAERVSLQGRFSARYPRIANAAIGLAGLAVCSLWWMPHVDLLGHAQARKVAATNQIKLEENEKLKATAQPVVDAVKRTPISAEALKPAQEAADLLKHSDGDSSKTRLQVISHMQDVEDALKKSAETETRFREAETDAQLLKNLETTKNTDTPMGKMQNDIKDQNFDKASEELTAAATQFANMDKKQQEQAIKEAQTLAAALAKAAGDPATQQQINNTLQQLSGDPKMAKDLAKAMADAAQGNPDAAAKLASLSKQIEQQMNNGQGPTPQQKQAMKQMMAQAQAAANSQAKAQAMAESAKGLAKAMSDAQQAQAADAPSQSASGQKSGGAQPQDGKADKAGQMAGGNQPSKTPSQQRGGGQGMATAQQNLQKQLDAMKNAQADAQSMANAQDAAKEAMDQAMQGNQSDGADAPDNNGQGQDAQGNTTQGDQQGGGQGNNQAGNKGQGRVNGGRRGVSAIPVSSYSTMDQTQDQANGKMLPSRYVKAGIDTGKANADAKAVAASAEKDDADDIEQDRIPKEAQKAVRDYFTDLQQQ